MKLSVGLKRVFIGRNDTKLRREPNLVSVKCLLSLQLQPGLSGWEVSGSQTSKLQSTVSVYSWEGGVERRFLDGCVSDGVCVFFYHETKRGLLMGNTPPHS